MRKPFSTLLGLTALLMIVSACSTSTQAVQATATPAYTATFAASPCQFTVDSSLTEGKQVICGYVTVPENRAKPQGNQDKIAVAVFKGAGTTVQPDPTIFLQGGPGGRIIQDLATIITAQDYPVLVGSRDLILVDQRGTGYSQPSLQCSEITNLTYSTIDQNLTAQQSVDINNTALKQCHDRLVQQGIDLSAYTTYNDAADVHDVFTALKYKQVNLYSVSYGTRLALEIMRSFPQGIRSVILDSNDPPQSNVLTGLPYAMNRIFNKLFSGCQSDTTCTATYPQLSTEFYNEVAKLNTTPVTFSATDPSTNKSYQVLFNGDSLVSIFFQSFYVTPYIADLPQILEQTINGDYSQLSSIFDQLYFDNSVSYGVYYSVSCSEDAPFVTSQQIDAASQTFPAAIRTDQDISLQGEYAGCKIWNVPAVSKTEKDPVTSSIPSLVLEGEYDPITPPTNGDETAKTLKNSYVFQFPGVGHGVYLSALCPIQMVNAFIANPGQKPTSSCINTMQEPAFK